MVLVLCGARRPGPSLSEDMLVGVDKVESYCLWHDARVIATGCRSQERSRIASRRALAKQQLSIAYLTILVASFQEHPKIMVTPQYYVLSKQGLPPYVILLWEIKLRNFAQQLKTT